jgi:hypothetical protein
MLRWPSLATEGTATFTMDWTKRLPSGSTLSSVAYAADPTNGLTFSSNSVASNVSTITITADKTEKEYYIKCTPTLSTGSISPVSVRIKVIKHKPAR